MVDDDDGDESPSPEPRTDSRSALPGEIRAWRRLHIIKRDESFSLVFSPRTCIYRVGVEVGGAVGGPRDRGARPGGGRAPTLLDRVWAPWSCFFHQYFLYFPKVISVDFQVIPRTFVFCTINNTMAVLLKTASVWISFIQIMLVRVRNKGKSV